MSKRPSDVILRNFLGLFKGRRGTSKIRGIISVGRELGMVPEAVDEDEDDVDKIR